MLKQAVDLDNHSIIKKSWVKFKSPCKCYVPGIPRPGDIYESALIEANGDGIEALYPYISSSTVNYYYGPDAIGGGGKLGEHLKI